MSQQQAIDINTIVAQAELLRERLAALDLLIADVQAAISNVEAALKTLSAISSSDIVLAPGDAGFNTIFKARVEDKEKVLYHIGGNIYAYLPRDKVEELLLRRLQTLGKTMNQLNKEKQVTADQLAQLEYIINAALAAARTQAGRQAPKT
ncbi:MAG: hypothetical protein F7C35_00405 [Desulfurococcales archaeon]|nr:hypothetical protein [Desulfurococcales archaeon]